MKPEMNEGLPRDYREHILYHDDPNCAVGTRVMEVKSYMSRWDCDYPICCKMENRSMVFFIASSHLKSLDSVGYYGCGVLYLHIMNV